MPSATGTPTCRAAASAASAFSRLWRPACEQSSRPAAAPRSASNAVVGDRPLRRRSSACRRRSAPRRVQTPARQHAPERRVLAVDDEQAVRRDRPHEVVELRLDRREVGKDVGVVELEVVEDRRARPVLDELRALVEERRVVLVGLDHEKRAVAVPRGNAEVDAARRRSGSPARGRRARGSTRASTTSSSCRACRPPRAPTCPAARARRATAGPTCSARPRSRIASISGLPRVTTLPTTNTSAPSPGRRAAPRRSPRQLDAEARRAASLIGG